MPISRRRPSTSTTPEPGAATVWAAGADAAHVVAAYPAIDAALKRRPGFTLVITVPEGELGPARRRLPHETVLPQPAPGKLPRWLRKVDPCLCIGIGPVGDAGVGVPMLRFDGGAAVSADAIVALLPARHASVPPISNNHLRRFVVRLFAGRPLCGLEALRDRLGRPAAILCLGNGPSSEEPALADVAFDRLFRVNWIWRGRESLTAPDVVFTADPDLPHRDHRPILCFPHGDAAVPILFRHALALRPPPAHLFLDHLPRFANDLARPPIPTNGALMIAVAAALRPARLVIAGIDLYAHAGGRYPGDTHALDGYSRQHDRDCDLALIRRALDGYDGTATIFGDGLRAALGRA